MCEEVFDLILQQFSEELFESNYEEICETNEESAPERENDSDDMEDESRHSDDEDESREGSKAAKNRDKTSIMVHVLYKVIFKCLF